MAINRINQSPVYTLALNDTQLTLIMHALNHLLGQPKNLGDTQQEKMVAEGEVATLVELLLDIPSVEAKEPGIIHGLCY